MAIEFEIVNDPDFTKATHIRENEEAEKAIVNAVEKLEIGQGFFVPRSVMIPTSVRSFLKKAFPENTEYRIRTKLTYAGDDKKPNGIRIQKLKQKTPPTNTPATV